MSDPFDDQHQSLRAAAQAQQKMRGQKALGQGNGPLSDYFKLGWRTSIIMFGVLSVLVIGLILLLILISR